MAAISETIYQVTACFAAGDVLRSYALFTDDLARLFGPEPGTPREVAEAFLAGGGEDEEGEQSEILAFASVMLLEDGRASAFIVDRYPSEDVLTYVHFEREGDTWLADEVIEFPSLLPEEEED